MRLTLKTKTALLVAGLAAGLLGLAGWWQREELGREYVALLQVEQEALARVVAADLDSKLALHLQQLARSGLAADARTFQDPAAQRIFFERLAGARPLFDGLALISLEGDVVANDPPLPQGAAPNIGDRAYFRQVLATRRPALSPPLLTRTRHQPAVMMLAPVLGEGGELIGMIGGGLSLLQSDLLGGMGRVPVGLTGHLVVVTQGADPVYVLHPDPRKLLQPVAGEDLPRDARQARLGAERLAPAPRTAIVTHAPVPSAGWELRVVLPADEAFAPLRRAEGRMLRELAVMALAIGGLVWLATQWLLRPLGALHRGVQMLRRDPHAEVRLVSSAPDEIGDLAREFAALVAEARAHQAELAAVSDASPLGLFRCAPDGRMTYVNETYLRIHGLARDQAAEGWLGTIPAEHRDRVAAAWRDAMRLGEPVADVHRIVRHDGVSLLLSVRTAPVTVDGRLIEQVGTVADITERSEADNARRMLTAVFDATTDYVVQHDTRGRMVYMNPAARRRAGIGLDEPVDHLEAIGFHPASQHDRLIREVVPTAMAQGVWLGESLVYDAQGQTFPVSHMVIAHRNEDGRVEQFSGILRDISAEKSAQQALAHSEATLRSVAEALPVIVAVVDREQRYRFTNSAFERWCGARRDLIVGRTVREVLGEQEYERSRGYLDGVLRGERQVFEKEYPSRERHCYLKITYIPLRAGDGSVDGFVGVAQDVSEHKAEERRLRELSQLDPLTGLLNRAGFEERIQEACEGARRRDELVALLYLDLDRFKPVNDAHGHATGDKLLKVFARRLRHAVRPSDVVARLGGDEFAVVLQGLHRRTDAQAVAAKLLDAAGRPFQIDALNLQIGASVGVAFLHPDDLGWQTLVERADRTMYMAKQAGRNRHAVASDELDSQLAPLDDLDS